PDGRRFAHLEGREATVIRVYPLPTGKEAKRPGFRWWVDPDYPWHEAQAQEAWQEGNWFAAAFHLGRLLDDRPWDARLHVRRAHALRQQANEREAAIHTLRALLLDPHVSWELPSSKPRLVMPRVAE